MLLSLTSSYSELLSLAAHCSKMLKKKNCLFNETCVPLFHFSSHAPHFMPFCAYLYLVFPHFFSWSSLLPRLRLCLLSGFFIFFILPQPKPLLPFLQPTLPNPSALLYSLWLNPPSQAFSHAITHTAKPSLPMPNLAKPSSHAWPSQPTLDRHWPTLLNLLPCCLTFSHTLGSDLQVVGLYRGSDLGIFWWVCDFSGEATWWPKIFWKKWFFLKTS